MNLVVGTDVSDLGRGFSRRGTGDGMVAEADRRGRGCATVADATVGPVTCVSMSD